MWAMPKMLKPVIVIILAVAVAAGAAVYLSRQPDESSTTNAAPLKADLKGGGHFWIYLQHRFGNAKRKGLLATPRVTHCLPEEEHIAGR